MGGGEGGGGRGEGEGVRGGRKWCHIRGINDQMQSQFQCRKAYKVGQHQ